MRIIDFFTRAMITGTDKYHIYAQNVNFTRICWKAGTVSRASKAPEARIRTRRRTGLSSQQVVWAPEVPPGLLLFHTHNTHTHTHTFSRPP